MDSSPDIHEIRLLDLEEEWHAGDSPESLHTFLKLTREEYASFVEGHLSAKEVIEKYDARSKE
jgi:hypothetical protein